jgi:translation initiation factor 1A
MDVFFKGECQEYGQVIKMLGNNMCRIYCFDGINRLCYIRGRFKKKTWISTGDIVLVGLRSFQQEKGDILIKYSNEEVVRLKAYGEIDQKKIII